MIRNIVEINEDKCNGCGLCVDACHEGAIEMIDGKARMTTDKYCDGLGACLPACPAGAITIIQREAEAFDEQAVKEKEEKKKVESKHAEQQPLACGCPGHMSKKLERTESKHVEEKKTETSYEKQESCLNQWPVQLRLINSRADYLKGADILIAADCTAYAYGNFHKDFIDGRICIIACPKLDNNDDNKEKLQEILENNDIKSVTVVRMEVPCCGGIIHAVKGAMLDAKKIIPYSEITIGLDGSIVK